MSETRRSYDESLPSGLWGTAPTLTSLAPSSIVAGAAPTLITVNGTGFMGASKVWVDEAGYPTQFVSPTQLTFWGQAEDVGAQDITVRTPGVSNGLVLTVTATAGEEPEAEPEPQAEPEPYTEPEPDA